MHLAAVMIEKYARRPLELAHHDPFGSMYDKGAGIGHERYGAKIYLLFLYIPYALNPAFLVDIIRQKSDNYLDRGLIGRAARHALLYGIFWVPNCILDKLKGKRAGKIRYGKDALKGRLKARVLLGIKGAVLLQKICIRTPLQLN